VDRGEVDPTTLDFPELDTGVRVTGDLGVVDGRVVPLGEDPEGVRQVRAGLAVDRVRVRPDEPESGDGGVVTLDRDRRPALVAPQANGPAALAEAPAGRVKREVVLLEDDLVRLDGDRRVRRDEDVSTVRRGLGDTAEVSRRSDDEIGGEL